MCATTIAFALAVASSASKDLAGCQQHVTCNAYGIVEESIWHHDADKKVPNPDTGSHSGDHEVSYCECRFADGTRAYLAADPIHFFNDGSMLRSGESVMVTIQEAGSKCEDDAKGDPSSEGTFPGGDRRRRAQRQADVSKTNRLVAHLQAKGRGRRSSGTAQNAVYTVASADRAPHDVRSPGVAFIQGDNIVDDGPRDWLVIRMNYVGGDISYCDEDCSYGIMHDYDQSVNNLYKDTSYNRVSWPKSLGNVVTVNMNKNVNSLGGCDFDAMGVEADAAARGLGANPANPDLYTHRIYVMPIDDVVGCDFAGVAYSSACDWGKGSSSCKAWVRHPAASVLAHELGHNLGVVHASTANADDNSVDCTYCDHSGIMGNGPLVGFMAPHRYALNWLNGANDILDHPADCSVQPVVTIAALDRAPDSGYGYSAARVARQLGGHYWFSFRESKRGFDQNLGSEFANKISVHYLRGEGFSTVMLKTLNVGETFVGLSGATGGSFSIQWQGIDSKGSALVLIDFGCDGATITTVATTLPPTWEGRECVDKNPTGWQDSSNNNPLSCATLKAWGLCSEAEFDGAVIDDCPVTCGVCDPNSGGGGGNPPPTVPTTTVPATTASPPTLDACVCRDSWTFNNEELTGCALTGDDPNPWCYTTAECIGSSASSSNLGWHWSYCEQTTTLAPTTTQSQATTTKAPTTTKVATTKVTTQATTTVKDTTTNLPTTSGGSCADLLAAERAKNAALQEHVEFLTAQLNAAQSCKSYTQKGRRAILA